jgi:hypothetical protein
MPSQFRPLALLQFRHAGLAAFYRYFLEEFHADQLI